MGLVNSVTFANFLRNFYILSFVKFSKSLFHKSLMYALNCFDPRKLNIMFMFFFVVFFYYMQVASDERGFIARKRKYLKT